MRIAAMVLVAAACGKPELSRSTLPFAIEAASDAKQPLIIELGATWCQPCRVFETQVLTDPRVKEALRGVVFVRYDVDTAAGRDAQRRCRTRAVPAVLGIDHAGIVRLRKIGTEPTADEFLVFMKQAHAVLDTVVSPVR